MRELDHPKSRWNGLPPALWLVPAGMLAAALLPLPYGYYTVLRICVCFAAAMIVWAEQDENGWSPAAILFAAIAILFNPFVPVWLTREIWAPIDLATAVAFVVHRRMRVGSSKDTKLVNDQSKQAKR